MLSRSLAVFASLLMVASPALAGDLDKGVQKRLEQLDMKFKVDNDNDFQLTMRVPGSDRTQLVIVNSGTYTYGDLEMREVYTPVLRVPSDGLPAGLAERLLVKTQDAIIGGWSVWKNGGVNMLIFSAKIPADMDRDGLRAIISAVSTSGDAMENELTTGGDKF